MNIFIQNVLVFATVVIAVTFLVKKFFFKKSKRKNPVGHRNCSNDDCGCH